MTYQPKQILLDSNQVLLKAEVLLQNTLFSSNCDGSAQ